MPSPTLLRNSRSFDHDEPHINHFGPATTPDIISSSSPRSYPPNSTYLSTQLYHAVDHSNGLRYRSVTRASSHYTELSAATDSDEEEYEGEYEINEEMRNWGWLLLVGCSLAFVLGVWSIAVGPFIDTSSVNVC